MILRDAVFSTPLYSEYAARVENAVTAAVSPLSIQLEQAMPQMVTEMNNLRGVLTTDFRNLGSELRGEIEGIRDDMESLETIVERGMNKQSQKSREVGTVLQSLTGVLQLLGGAVFETRLRLPESEDTAQTFTSNSMASGNGLQQPATQTTSTSTNQTPHDDSSSSSNAASSPDRRPVDSAASALFSGMRTLAPLLEAAEAAARRCGSEASEGGGEANTSRHPSQLSSTPQTSPMPSTFVMESNHTTVVELWNEWNQGVAGRPSISDMVKAGLRKSDGQRKLFTRRKIIIDEIKELAKARVVPVLDIVGILDAYRATNRLSITKLQDEIRRKKAEGKSIV